MSWKLVADLDAYVFEGSKVCLVLPGNKQHASAITRKRAKEEYIKVWISENSFKVRLNDCLGVEVKSDQLPNKDTWYEVCNFGTSPYASTQVLEDLGKILSQVDSNRGDFGDVEFEAAFSDNIPGQVYLVCQGMVEYKKVFEEMRRQVSVQSGKKTRKLIPGHRYDTEHETLYFLGEFTAHSQYRCDGDMQNVNLFTKDPKGATTISEVLKSQPTETEKGIFVKGSLMAVDSGEELKNDVPPDLTKLRKEILQARLKENIVEDKNGLTIVECPKKVLDTFVYFCEDFSTVTEEERSLVLSMFDILLKRAVIKYWEVNAGVARVLATNGPAVNRVNLITNTFRDEFISGEGYYKELVRLIGIDLSGQAELALSQWSLSELDDFDTYLKVIGVFGELHKSIKGIVDQRSFISYRSKVRLGAVVENGVLRDAIVLAAAKGIENYGIGLDSFNETNVGTIRRPVIFVDLTITAKNLVDYFSGVEEYDLDKLKKAIVENRFVKLEIMLNKNSNIVI